MHDVLFLSLFYDSTALYICFLLCVRGATRLLYYSTVPGTRQRGTNREHTTHNSLSTLSLSQEVYTAHTGAVRNTGVTHGVRCTVSPQSTKTPPTPAQQRENARFVCAPQLSHTGQRHAPLAFQHFPLLPPYRTSRQKCRGTMPRKRKYAKPVIKPVAFGRPTVLEPGPGAPPQRLALCARRGAAAATWLLRLLTCCP